MLAAHKYYDQYVRSTEDEGETVILVTSLSLQ